MKILLAAAVVLLATGLHARAQEPKPQTSQHVLTIPLPSSGMWYPGIYATAERCETARKVFLASVRGIGLRRAVCAELLSP